MGGWGEGAAEGDPARSRRRVTLRERIGFDAGGTPLEQVLGWAARHDFHYVDFNADLGENHLDGWSAERVTSVQG